MNAQRARYAASGKIMSGGRLQLPVVIRKHLGLSDGDIVVLEVKDNALYVRSYDESVKRAQDRLKHMMPKDGTRLSDELIADRRKEAENE
jgi:antitoxin PrlF